MGVNSTVRGSKVKPASVRVALGSDLRRLQFGELPPDSKPMKTVGPGVRELRAKSRDNQFRAIYFLAKSDDVVVPTSPRLQ
jgi:phage-related protein